MSLAPEQHTKTAGETKTLAVDYRGSLDTFAGELLTGTVTTSSTPSGLTISSATVTAAEKYIKGTPVPAGQAVTMKVAGGTAGTTYTITVTVNSDSGQVALEATLSLRVT